MTFPQVGAIAPEQQVVGTPLPPAIFPQATAPAALQGAPVVPQAVPQGFPAPQGAVAPPAVAPAPQAQSFLETLKATPEGQAALLQFAGGLLQPVGGGNGAGVLGDALSKAAGSFTENTRLAKDSQTKSDAVANASKNKQDTNNLAAAGVITEAKKVNESIAAKKKELKLAHDKFTQAKKENLAEGEIKNQQLGIDKLKAEAAMLTAQKKSGMTSAEYSQLLRTDKIANLMETNPKLYPTRAKAAIAVDLTDTTKGATDPLVASIKTQQEALRGGGNSPEDVAANVAATQNLISTSTQGFDQVAIDEFNAGTDAQVLATDGDEGQKIFVIGKIGQVAYDARVLQAMRVQLATRGGK